MKLSDLLKYVSAAAFAGTLVRLTLDLHGYDAITGAPEQYRLLADAFTIPGVCLIMVRLLVLAAEEGVFDGIGYALTFTASTLVPGLCGKKTEAYAEYITRKRAYRTGEKGNAFLWHVGAVFMIPAAVYTGLFYTV